MLITRDPGVPRHDVDCILHEILCLKRWDTSRGLKQCNSKWSPQNPRPPPGRPPERKVQGAAAPRKKPCV